MGYQFHCPQGHLLEADPSSIGQPTSCPICGVPFLVPMPVATPVPTAFAPTANIHHAPMPLSSAGAVVPPLLTGGPTNVPGRPDPQVPIIGSAAGPIASGSDGSAVDFAWSPSHGSRPKRAAEAKFAAESDEPLHIPCPSGHELEVPREMLDQDALCPTCQIQFRLRAKDSLEHKRRQREAYERRQHKLGQAWLNWSVAIAVIVVLGLLVMLGLRAGR